MSISVVLEKVKKLLALSKSSNPNEAAAATAAANKLIDQYRLDQADLDASDEANELVFEDDQPLYESGRITQWKSSLAIYLAKHYSCAVYNNKSYRKNNYNLIGRKSDIEVVKYMFSWLCLEIERLSGEASKGKGFDRSYGKTFSNSFCSGAVAGINEQLQASRKEVMKNASSNALIKLDQRLKDAQDFMNDAHNLRKTKYTSSSRMDYSAYANGKVSGSNIHLGAGLNAAKGVRLLGS